MTDTDRAREIARGLRLTTKDAKLGQDVPETVRGFWTTEEKAAEAITTALQAEYRRGIEDAAKRLSDDAGKWRNIAARDRIDHPISADVAMERAQSLDIAATAIRSLGETDK